MHEFELDSVHKHFDNRSILTDVYLKCKTGDIIGLLGRNGSGKSTLLQIIFGIVKAEKFIRIDGQTYEQPYKTNGLICYLPQHEFIPKNLMLKNVVELYLGKVQKDSFFNDDLLKALYKNKIGTLSGGELKYFETKLLLTSNSKFALLDEPFNGVAPIMIEKIKALIVSASYDKGIILSDHDYRNVMEINTACFMLHKGSLKEIHGTDDLLKWNYISKI